MPRNFFVVLPVAEVARPPAAFAPVPSETASLTDPRGLEGRVLAADVIAGDDVPLTSRSGMDGYAVQAADVFGASEGNPVYLALTGRIAVDRRPTSAWNRADVRASSPAARCRTGPTPWSWWSTVPNWPTAKMGSPWWKSRVPVAPGTHVLRRGDDAREGPARRSDPAFCSARRKSACWPPAARGA